MNEWQKHIKRLERKHSLREIARLVGLSPGALCDIKKGRTKQPKLEPALKLRSA